MVTENADRKFRRRLLPEPESGIQFPERIEGSVSFTKSRGGSCCHRASYAKLTEIFLCGNKMIKGCH
jgi:hypothetical protein